MDNRLASEPNPTSWPQHPVPTFQVGLVTSSRSTPSDGRRVISPGPVLRRTVALSGNASEAPPDARSASASAAARRTTPVAARPITKPSDPDESEHGDGADDHEVPPRASGRVPGSFGCGAGRSANNAAISAAVTASAAPANRSTNSAICRRPALRWLLESALGLGPLGLTDARQESLPRAGARRSRCRGRP